MTLNFEIYTIIIIQLDQALLNLLKQILNLICWDLFKFYTLI